jgi:ATP-binding cassette subfamily B protein/subfamily B ATP-binding cassette protein MsbA
VDCVFGGQPLPPWLRSLSGGDQGALVIILVLAAFVLQLAQGGLSAGQNYLSIQVGLAGLRRVRDEVFACLQRLSLRFHQGARSGDLIHRAAWDTFAFQTLFQQGLITGVTASLSLVLMIVVMWRINFVLTLVSLTIVPLLLLVLKRFSLRMTEKGLAAQHADSQVTSFVQQSIVALPLIQSYTREEHEESAFTSRTLAAQQKRLAQHGLEILYWLAIAIVFAMGAAGLLWFGSQQVMAGQLTVGQLLIFLEYLRQFYDPLNQLSHVGATVATATAGTQRVFEILDTPEEVKDLPNALPAVNGLSEESSTPLSRRVAKGPRQPAPGARAVRVVGNIEFDRVTFAYQKGQPVLQEVSFNIAPHQTVAIIGPSGVGKTTLLNLLPRFFDPTGGSVRLEGIDLRQMRLKDLRAQMALVLQEPLLLPASIAENIAYGKSRASRSEIEAAAHAAHADQFISKMPNAYNTIVGEGGTRLSAGERQRLNLARAFLKDAPILLLDEPTSALDAESEALVVSSLFHLMTNRTTLMVAHRLTTIRQVHKILVLQEGRLIEEGSPDELIERQGYYARVAGGQVELE